MKMMKTILRYFIAGVLLTSSGIFVSACENTLDPFDEQKGSYSIYGYLNMYQDVNYIRVNDLNQPLTEEATKTIDVTVTLEEVNSNTIQTLPDSIVKFEDVYTHNFYTTLDITAETSYRITVEGSDGRTITATARTPRIADVAAEPTGKNCEAPVQVTFNPVIDRHSLEVSVGFDYQGDRHWANRLVQSGEGESVQLKFEPQAILNAVFPPDRRTREPAIQCFELDSDIFYVRYTHYGPNFFEDTGSDSVVIPSGTVRFGGLYKDLFSFPIDTTEIED